MSEVREHESEQYREGVRMTHTESPAKRMSDAYNRAVDGWQSGDRAGAEKHICDALKASLELPHGPYELGWRALILYNRGLNLLRLHGLEACSPIPQAKHRAAVAILGAWEDFMRTAKPLLRDRNFVAFFRDRHGLDLARAVQAVQNDPIYRRCPIEVEMGGRMLLVPWFGTPESMLPE